MGYFFTSRTLFWDSEAMPAKLCSPGRVTEKERSTSPISAKGRGPVQCIYLLYKGIPKVFVLTLTENGIFSDVMRFIPVYFT